MAVYQDVGVSSDSQRKALLEIARARKIRRRDLLTRLGTDTDQLDRSIQELEALGFIGERSYPVPSLKTYYITSKGLRAGRRAQSFS